MQANLAVQWGVLNDFGRRCRALFNWCAAAVLQVHGVQNLRVVDASVIPVTPGVLSMVKLGNKTTSLHVLHGLNLQTMDIHKIDIHSCDQAHQSITFQPVTAQAVRRVRRQSWWQNVGQGSWRSGPMRPPSLPSASGSRSRPDEGTAGRPPVVAWKAQRGVSQSRPERQAGQWAAAGLLQLAISAPASDSLTRCWAVAAGCASRALRRLQRLAAVRRAQQVQQLPQRLRQPLSVCC